MGALGWVVVLGPALPESTPHEDREWAGILGATGRALRRPRPMEALVEDLPEHKESLRSEAPAFRARLN